MNNKKPSIGKAVKLIRTMRGLKQGQLGVRCGFVNSYISHVENGVRDNLTIETVEKIAKGLSVDMMLLLYAAGYGRDMLSEDTQKELAYKLTQLDEL